MLDLRRRQFITLLGGAAAAWPLAARAQQARTCAPRRRAYERGRGRSGRTAAPGSISQAPAGIGLDRRPQCANRRALGRRRGRAHSQIRGGAGCTRPGRHSGQWRPPVVALQQATSTVPIIFAMVADPVGAGFVESLAHPGRNTTGFTLYEYSTTAKWPELLKEIAPGVKRVAVIREAGTAAGTGQFTGVQAGVPGLGLELSPIGVRDAGEMERAVAAFSRSPNGGMIVTGSAQAAVHRDLIVTLAARHKLPAVYVARFFVTAGGLISYGPDFLDEHRRAAGYVDRILKGEKAG